MRDVSSEPLGCEIAYPAARSIRCLLTFYLHIFFEPDVGLFLSYGGNYTSPTRLRELSVCAED